MWLTFVVSGAPTWSCGAFDAQYIRVDYEWWAAPGLFGGTLAETGLYEVYVI